MNRRKFMQLCGLAVGGGVMGIGRAAIKDTEQGWSVERLCSQGIAQPYKRQFMVRMTTLHVQITGRTHGCTRKDLERGWRPSNEH